MRVWIFFSFVCFSFTSVRGEHITCHGNAETQNVAIKTRNQECPESCMKLVKSLPDGTVVIIRGCGKFKWESSAENYLDDLHLSTMQKELLLTSAPLVMYLCDGDFCNDGYSSKSFWLTSLIALTILFIIT